MLHPVKGGSTPRARCPRFRRSGSALYSGWSIDPASSQSQPRPKGSRWLSPRPSKDRDSELSWTFGKLATCRQPPGKRACAVGRECPGRKPGRAVAGRSRRPRFFTSRRSVRGCATCVKTPGSRARRLTQAAELSESTVERIERADSPYPSARPCERIAGVLYADVPELIDLAGRALAPESLYAERVARRRARRWRRKH